MPNKTTPRNLIYILPKAIEEHLNFLKKDEAENIYSKKVDLVNYITKEEAEAIGSIGPDTLKKYVMKNDLPELLDTSLDKVDITSKLNLEKLGKTIVIPNMVDEAKVLEITNQAIRDADIQIDLTNYYSKSEVDSKISTKVLETLDTKEYVTQTTLVEALKTVELKEETKNAIINTAIERATESSNSATDTKLEEYGTKSFINAEITKRITDISSGNITLDGYATEDFVNNKIRDIVIPDISVLANKDDVYNKTETYSKSEVYTQAEVNGLFLKTNDANTIYSKKTELTEKVNDLESKIETKHQDSLQKVNELTDIVNANKEEADSKYRTKEDADRIYLKISDAPVMDLYYKKSETEARYALKANYYNRDTSDNRFASKSVMENEYARKADLSNLVNAYTKDQADIKFFTIEASASYAKKTDVPNLTNSYTREQADGKFLDITTANDTYLKKTDNIDIDAYSKQESDEKYALKTVATANTANIGKVNTFLDGYLTEGNKLSTVLTAIQTSGQVDLSNYYTKNDANLRFATINSSYLKNESDDKYALKDSSYSKGESDSKYAIASTVNNNINGVITKVDKVENFLDSYLTTEPMKNLPVVIQELQDSMNNNHYTKQQTNDNFATKESLENYALKSEIGSGGGSEVTREEFNRTVANMSSTLTNIGFEFDNIEDTPANSKVTLNIAGATTNNINYVRNLVIEDISSIKLYPLYYTPGADYKEGTVVLSNIVNNDRNVQPIPNDYILKSGEVKVKITLTGVADQDNNITFHNTPLSLMFGLTENETQNIDTLGTTNSNSFVTSTDGSNITIVIEADNFRFGKISFIPGLNDDKKALTCNIKAEEDSAIKFDYKNIKIIELKPINFIIKYKFKNDIVKKSELSNLLIGADRYLKSETPTMADLRDVFKQIGIDIPLTKKELKALGKPGHNAYILDMKLTQGGSYGSGMAAFTIKDMSEKRFALKYGTPQSDNGYKWKIILTNVESEMYEGNISNIPPIPRNYSLKDTEFYADIETDNCYTSSYATNSYQVVGIFLKGSLDNGNQLYHYFLGTGSTANFYFKFYYTDFIKSIKFKSGVSGRYSNNIDVKVYTDTTLRTSEVFRPNSTNAYEGVYFGFEDLSYTVDD